MKAQVQWVDGAMFVAESPSGHAVVIDGPPDGGGRNLGPRPMELVLMGTGACSTYDVVSILRKARQDIVDCRVEIDAERADGVPQVFTRIHLHFVVSGRGLSAAQVERAVRLSADKYCSASIMLARAGVAMSHDFKIVELS